MNDKDKAQYIDVLLALAGFGNCEKPVNTEVEDNNLSPNLSPEQKKTP